MKTADRRNRILLLYVTLLLGLFAYERLSRSVLISRLLRSADGATNSSSADGATNSKSRPHAPHEPAGTIFPLAGS
jgi:hypothetical protein